MGGFFETYILIAPGCMNGWNQTWLLLAIKAQKASAPFLLSLDGVSDLACYRLVFTYVTSFAKLSTMVDQNHNLVTKHRGASIRLEVPWTFASRNICVRKWWIFSQNANLMSFNWDNDHQPVNDIGYKICGSTQMASDLNLGFSSDFLCRFLRSLGHVPLPTSVSYVEKKIAEAGAAAVIEMKTSASTNCSCAPGWHMRLNE